MIDWISKIDFTTPNAYRANPDSTANVAQIPGQVVLECTLPTESIKSDDDFFAGDAQEIDISIQYDPALIPDSLFYALTEATPTSGINGVTRYTDELDGCIVKIYNRDNVRVFDGVLRVDGKSFDTESFIIKFKVYNLMRLMKERSGLTANDPDGTIGKPISFVDITAAEFNFFVNSAFKEFKPATGYPPNANNWAISPMAITNTSPKMGIGEFTGQELGTVNIAVGAVDESNYYSAVKSGQVGIQMFYIYRRDDAYFIIRFQIYHPWRVDSAYYNASYYDSLQDAINTLTTAGYTLTQGNAISYNGVSYSMEYIPAYPQRVRLKGYTGKWLASNLKILPTATIGQVIKLYLLLCGWKMAIKKNAITVTQNYYSSITGVTAIQPTVSQIKDFQTVTIMPYSPLDSDVFDILDETDTAKAAIKSAVETNYNRYLPKITKECELTVHSSAGVPVVGGFIITPIVPSVPNLGGQTWNRTYFVYEITQDQEDNDWYNCKAYNIS